MTEAATQLEGVHASPVPLYRQIERILRERIRSGEWRAGARLPSEDELAGQFRVSKITVRQALGRLASQQLVVRRPGRGTFVTGRTEPLEPPTLLGFLDDLSALDARTTLQVLDRRVVTARRLVAEALELEADAKVVAVRRLRLDAEGPISYIEAFLPLDLGEKISETDVAGTLVVHLLERKLGVVIDEARQTTTASAASAAMARHLQVAVGTPVLRVERVFLGTDRRPLCFMVLIFRSDRYRYTVSYRRRDG